MNSEEFILPTGKPHVSFSEVRIWKECGWRHKLIYIDKLLPFETSVHLEYGTIIHDALEYFLKTRQLKIEETKSKIREVWKNNNFDDSDNIKASTLLAEQQGWRYKHNYLNDWLAWSENTLNDISSFMDKNYPDWKFVSAEEQLYEPIKDSIYLFGFIIKSQRSKNDYESLK